MSFKGDLSTIGLAEVFQMISMSQKEGTLIVQDAESRKAIYFGPTGVKLVSTGKRKGLRLGDILVRAGRITEESLQEALETAKISRKLLGEVLIENGYVTEADVQQIVREQIEEEIYDLFLWKRANFEFVEGPSTEGLKDVDAPVTKLSFDVNGLLLEAVRRADEWAVINQKLPSVDSIFAWTSPQSRAEEDQYSADSAKRVYRLVDGQTPVSEIIENTGVGKFEGCKILVDLFDRARIRLLEIQEMIEVAQKRMAEGQRDRGVKLYLASAAQAPQDPKAAAAVARVLEGEGLAREAALQHARAARLFIDQGDLDRALDHMRKAAELAPDDPDIRMGMFEVHAASGNLEEGKRLAMDLATRALMEGDSARARTLCDRILRADPEDMAFRVLRAKALHRLNQKKDLEEDLTFIRRKMPVDQGEAEKINRDLKEILARTPTTKASPSTVKGLPAVKKKKGAAVGIAVVVLLLGGLGAGGKYELDARKELKAAIARSADHMQAQSFVEARRQLEAWLAGTYRFSLTQKGKAEEALRSVDDQAAAWEQKKAQRLEAERLAALERMRSLEAAVGDERHLNPESALEKARTLRDVAAKANDLSYIRRAEEMISSLEKTLADALQLKVQADAMEKEGRFREAALAVERLIREFPNTRSAQGALYPLEITTRPAGVKVSTRAGLVLGDTGQGPVRHRMKDVEAVRLLFQKPGYASVEVQVRDKTVGRLHQDLTEKRERWAMPLGFSVSGEPAMGEDMLFVAGGSRLYALRLSTQRLLWTEGMESAIAGSPRTANGLVYVAAGREIAAFDPKQPDRRVAWKVTLSERATCTPGLSADGAVLYVSTADRMLTALKGTTGEPVWKKPLPAEAVAEPVAAADALVVACQDGTVIGFKAGTPEEAWRTPGDAGYVQSGVSGPYVYLTGTDQTVHAIDARTGTRAWRRTLAVALSGRPVRVGNAVYVAGREGKVHFLDAATGETVGTYETAGPILGGVTAAGPLLLFGSDDQSFHAFDTVRGVALWKWKNKGKLRNPAVVADGVAYFCGEDTLYAIELN